MKKLIAMLTVGAFLAVSTVGCGPAASTPLSGGTAAAKETTTVTGKVVSATSDSLKLKDGDKEVTITVPTEVKPMLDGKEVKLDELKGGEAVTVTKLGDKVTKVDAKK